MRKSGTLPKATGHLAKQGFTLTARSVAVEPKTGIEPVTSFLPRKRSTTELQGQVTFAASGIRYPHRVALKGGWTACRTAALVSSERGAVRTFTRYPFLPVRGNTPLSTYRWTPPAPSRRYQVPPLVGSGIERMTGVEPATFTLAR